MSSKVIPADPNYTGSLIIPLDLCFSPDDNDPGLALGYYRIEVREDGVMKDYMYIDYRTSHLPAIFDTVKQIDIEFEYDDSNNKLYYKGSQNEVVSETIWNMWDHIKQKKVGLEPKVPWLFDVAAVNNHPRLSWAHNQNEDYIEITGYAVYRSVVGKGNPPGSFSKIATLSPLVEAYVDYDFVTGSTNTAYYKITAINGSRESQYTQTKSIDVSLFKEGGEVSIDYELKQNYPNPFNPTTTISYSIPSDEHVTLKVYNTLGEEVAELVNEVKIAGVYSTDFNAENLPSGIYFYTIAAGKYTNTKKLLLIK